MPRWRFVAAAAALAAYALLSHALMVTAPASPWAVAVLFGPLLLALAFAGWQRRHRPTLAACAVLVALLAVVVAQGGVEDVNRLYVLQHAAYHLALAGAFAVTLRPGGTALITAMARRVHHKFSPAMEAYTRRLTAVWVAYFIGMVPVSLTLYALAPWSWWSVYCNLLTPLAVLTLFVGEHLLRYRRHPEFERASLAMVWQAWRAAGASTSR